MAIKLLIVALFYGFLATGPYFAFCNPLRNPSVIGLVIGIILGDPLMGAVTGAYLGLIYLGQITIAGQMPSNRMVGSVIGVTFAIISGLGYEASLAIAVPLGLATANLRNWVETGAVVFGSGIARSIQAHSIKKARLWGLLNVLFKVALYTSIMFIALQFGVSNLATAFEHLPQWVMNGLNVGGSVLPAVGIALGLCPIADGGKIWLAVAAFVASKLLGLSTVGAVVITIAVCVFYVYGKVRSGAIQFGDMKSTGEIKHILSFGDVFRACFRCTNNSVGEDMARKNSNNWLFGMYPVMKKLYPNDEDRQYKELIKHDTYVEMFAAFMSFIAGPVVMMEEERALGNDSVTPESIQSFKASLMGPVRALGDSLGAGVILIITNSIGISIAQAGNPIGAVVTYVLEVLFPVLICLLAAKLCYKYGSGLIQKLYNGTTSTLITDLVGIVGCVAFGTLLASSLRFGTGDLTVFGVNLQTTLFDGLLPGIIPLTLALVCYNLLKKKKITIVPLLTIVFFVCFALGALGILA